MKWTLIALGFFLKFKAFSTEEKIYCSDADGANVLNKSTISHGYICSCIDSANKIVYSCEFLNSIFSDEKSDPYIKNVQYFEYFIDSNTIHSSHKCEWNLNICVDTNEDIKNEKYKLFYQIFIRKLNDKEKKWFYLEDFSKEEIYISQKDKFDFKRLVIKLPITKIKEYFNLKEQNITTKKEKAHYQLMLVPYVTSKLNFKGKIYTKCRSQCTVDEEENEMPYLIFK